MKQFLSKLFLFAATFLLLMNVLVLIGNSLTKHKVRNVYTLPQGTKYVVMGNSRPECSINDSLIEHLSNFSKSGEAYFYTYLKVKELLSYNKKLEAALIQFTLEDITTKRDDWVWNKINLSSNYDNHSYAMTMDEYNVLMTQNLAGFIYVHHFQTIVRQFRNIFLMNDIERKKQWGGYLPLSKENTEKTTEVTTPTDSLKISPIHKKYLIETIKLLSDNNVKVFLISTPLLKPDKDRLSQVQVNEELGKYSLGTHYIDFQNFPLSNSDFADPWHLNRKGAIKFSKFLNTLLNEGVLNHSDSLQNLIEIKMKSQSVL
ncbi:MAG: hypothetical protein IPN76_10365 [Saprospiraceae bacterium]|nr:hypothetical protein [Saprospiraceae bacterium]